MCGLALAGAAGLRASPSWVSSSLNFKRCYGFESKLSVTLKGSAPEEGEMPSFYLDRPFQGDTQLWAKIGAFSKFNYWADTLPPHVVPILPNIDSLPPTLPKLSVERPSPPDSVVVDLSKVKFSNEGLDEAVDYGAKDSMWFDVAGKQLHLYGNAFVKYTSIDLKANYIVLDYGQNLVNAKGYPDSSGQIAGLPQFKDGDQEFGAKELKYNFKTKKGIIYEAVTKQEDLWVHGAKAKFVGGAASADSTLKGKNVVYNADAIITTCDAPVPHFGIHTNKLKVIPDKWVITGLSNLEIGGVPTPLILPFGFFPISKTKTNGLIFPKDFENSTTFGFGFKNIGYYIPISDHMDVTLWTDLYLRGTVRFGAEVNYLKRYKYRGNFNLEFNNRVGEDAKANPTSEKSYGLRWTHNQDTKANPVSTLGGSVQIETNQNQNRNRNDYNSVYQNTLRSNLSWTRRFPGTPFNLTASMNHSQNTQTRLMNISLPNVSFQMQQIYPLRRKNRVGSERFYEQLSLSYSSNLKNDMTATDTTLFTRQTLEKAQIGMQHRFNSSLPIKVLKYITVSPNASYEENWYPYIVEHQLLNKDKIHYDTNLIQGERIITIDPTKSQFGKDTIVRDWGFNAFRQWSLGVSANTSLYGTMQFKKGWLRGIRHVFKPSVSFGTGPDFSKPSYGYFKNYYTSRLPQFSDTLNYSIFDQAAYSRPSNSKRQLSIGYSLGNSLEIKIRAHKGDSTYAKRVKIFDNLAFTGSYSITADSLKWSTITTSGGIPLIKNISQLRWGIELDPYVTDVKGRRINRFVWDEKGKLLRLSNLNISLSTGFTLSQIRDFFKKKDDKTGSPAVQSGQNQSSDKFLDWFDRFRIQHDINFTRSPLPGNRGDTTRITFHSLGVSGDIPLTSKWQFRIGHIGYDFPTQKITYPDLSISRDLHCWQMSFSWQPERGTYLFSISTKPGSLDFLKLPYTKNNADARLSF